MTPTVEPTREPAPPPPEEPEPSLDGYGVNAGHPVATAAGMEVLAAGGSAVDAAVAAALTVSVVEPFASGLGGGGSAVVVPAGEEPVAYDFREVVPGGGIPSGGAGVPGLAAGLGLLHAEHGRLPWADLVEPAVRAAEGTEVSGMLAAVIASPRGASTRGIDHMRPGGRPLAAGATLVQEDLAATLRTLAAEGPQSFVDGTLAASLAAAGVGVSTADLAEYRVQVSEDPPRGGFGDVEVVTVAPALPGVALIQTLQVAETAGLASEAPGSSGYLHALAASWTHALGQVEQVLGDPAFVDVPVEQLTDRAANAAAGATLGDTARTVARDATGGTETTHIAVVDADGTAVSMSNTLTNFWGSGQVVDGYVLNNQMVRFSVGASGSNVPEPGRRSVSWAVPTVVLDDQGRPVLVLGSPGGERIPMVLADVLARRLLHGASLQDAVSAPRAYADGRRLDLERLPEADVRSALAQRGYEVTGPVARESWLFGSVQALEVDWEAGTVTGARDERREAAVSTAP